MLRIVDAQRMERQEMAGIQINVVTHLGEVPPVQGNTGDLRDALTNIVLNAMDAMPRGGQLTIETRQRNGQVVIAISDTGIGMPEELKRPIFDPFFTTKGTQGSGLGLSVAYGAVSRHGGQIEVDSALNQGTTFRINLPVANHSGSGLARVTRPYHTEPTTILLVDDDREVGDVLRQILAQAGHEVTLVNSGEKALASFREQEFGLVITDLGLPDISGRDVAREVSELKPDIPIILITGWGVQLDPREVADCGIAQIIAKPFSREELLSRVAQLLESTPE